MKNLILLILIFCQVAISQSFDKTKLDKYFNSLDDNKKFMGSVAVSKNGEIIYLKSVGYADINNKIKANNESKYRIGSISKSFTAILVLKAVENRKLELNQTIDKWFPTIKNSEKISVKQLLNHRSGIYNFTNSPNYLSLSTQAKTEEEMIEIIKAGGNNFSPDSKAEYSNSNYVLLTYILEKTFSKSYSELLNEYIINPAGLKNTYVFGKINTINNESRVSIAKVLRRTSVQSHGTPHSAVPQIQPDQITIKPVANTASLLATCNLQAQFLLLKNQTVDPTNNRVLAINAAQATGTCQ